MVMGLYSLRSIGWISLMMVALGVALSACGGSSSSTAPAASVSTTASTPTAGTTVPTTTSTSTAGTNSFTVGVPARLTVDNYSGPIHVQTGSGTTVVIHATKHSGVGGADPQITMNQSDSTTVKIETHGQPGSSVDLDVTMPSDSQLQLQTGYGDIRIEGINGQMNSKTGSGSITASQVSFNSNSLLSTGSGDITFDGSLDPKGTFRMETGSGSVILTLPANSSLSFDLHTFSGSIDNSFGSNEIGSLPRAKVLIQTGSGSITINKR